MSGSNHPPALEVNHLTVSYRQGKNWLDAVRDVSLVVEPGRSYGLVGESGSGKSTLALAVMRYLSENGAIRRGSIKLAGRDLMDLSEVDIRQVWGEQVKLVPQNPLSSLNPSLRIGEQITEALDPSLSSSQAQERVGELLEMVRLADPERVTQSYPHQLSGGQQQRVMIAMALSGEPALLVLDEPTTNLDVTTEAAILDLVEDLIAERNTAVLYVSHNLGVVARICDRVAVLYAGELVEDAAVGDLYCQPLHPYTQGLLDSVPRIGQTKHETELRPIPGYIPQLDALPSGCVFAPRCPLAIDLCSQERPTLDAPSEGRRVRCFRWQEIYEGTVSLETPTQAVDAPQVQASDPTNDAVLNVTGVEKHFSTPRSIGQLLRGEPSGQIRAVDKIDLQVRQTKTLGLVGESGSGKTTLARCIIGLAERSSGEISLLDIPLADSLSGRDREILRQLQMVFQNPEDALNPYRTVGDILSRTLRHLAGCSRKEANEGVAKLLTAVKLSPSYAQRMPNQLSGGEKQRIAIARAFASHPDLILFDESVSALDVSVQASILNLLNELQRDNKSAYLFISHDLAVVSYLADEIAVVYLGHLMEIGRTADVLQPPYHPYTEALLSAIPLPHATSQQTHIRLEGDVPSAINIPSGCRFHTRCPRFLGDICVEQEPSWQEGGNGHRIYCHIPLAELKQKQRHLFELRGQNGN
jgi:peptide/nickel transport system ATP-binding protein